MENNNYFSDEAMQRISAANYEGGEKKKVFKEQKKKIEPLITEMYEPSLFKNTVRTDMIRASELFKIISKKFGDIFSDYSGCQLMFAANGMPEFIMVFEYRGPASNNGKVQALKLLHGNPNQSALQSVIEASRNINNNGIRTMDLTDEAKAIMMPFMATPVTINQSSQPVAKELKWENCVFEKKVDELIYGHPTRSRIAFIVRNIDVQKIIDNMITTPEQKAKDLEEARKQYYRFHPVEKVKRVVEEEHEVNGVMQKVNVEKMVTIEPPESVIREYGITPRFQSAITFKGYMHNDQYNRVSYSQYQLQTMPDGRVIPMPSFDWENYWITIQVLDTVETRRMAPVFHQNNDGFFSTLITP